MPKRERKRLINAAGALIFTFIKMLDIEVVEIMTSICPRESESRTPIGDAERLSSRRERRESIIITSRALVLPAHAVSQTGHLRGGPSAMSLERNMLRRAPI